MCPAHTPRTDDTAQVLLTFHVHTHTVEVPTQCPECSQRELELKICQWRTTICHGQCYVTALCDTISDSENHKQRAQKPHDTHITRVYIKNLITCIMETNTFLISRRISRRSSPGVGARTGTSRGRLADFTHGARARS